MALEPITRQEQIIAGKDLEPITRMERFLKEYGGGAGGVVSDEQIKNAVENYLDENPIGVDLSVTGATVGQTVIISAVDENGAPTAWEAADGGEKEWKLVCDFITEEEVKSFSVNKDIDGNDLYLAPNEETLIFLIAAPTDTNTAKKSAMFLLNEAQTSNIPNFIYNGTTNYTRRYIEFGKDPNGVFRINKGFEYSPWGNNVFDNGWNPVVEGSSHLVYNSNIANGLVSVGGMSLDGTFGIGSRISVYVKKGGN